MIIISARDLTKAYGTDVILDKVSFHINEGDRVGIIGINGAGKTTLLRMLTEDLDHEEGDVFISADRKIGYLQQDTGFESDNTVIEEVNRIFSHFPEMEKEMQKLLQEAGSLDPENPRAMELIHRHDAIRERFEYMGGYAYESEIRGVLTSMAFDESTYNKKISTLSGGE